MISIYQNGIKDAGIHFTFKHCYVSIQIGEFNYCQARMGQLTREEEYVSCEDCEVAIIERDTGRWLTKQMNIEVFDNPTSDDVIGWVKTKNLPEILTWARDYETTEE